MIEDNIGEGKKKILFRSIVQSIKENIRQKYLVNNKNREDNNNVETNSMRRSTLILIEKGSALQNVK